MAAEAPPYEFDAKRTLTGGCTPTSIDPEPDPGCPTAKPPKPFETPTAVAIDSFGNEYVASFGPEENGSKGRIDIFDSEGKFITQIPDPFGPRSLAVDSKGNIYVIEKRTKSPFEFARYSPTEYEPKTGKIKYGEGARTLISDAPGSKYSVAVDRSNDRVFVAQDILISEYGSLAEENKLLDTITSDRLYANQFVAVDAQRRRLYASSCPDEDITECWVIVFDADDPHELLAEVTGENTPQKGFTSEKGWTSIGVDEKTGDFFVEDLEQTDRIYQFDEDYEYVSTLVFTDFAGGEPLQIAVSNAEGQENQHYLFVPNTAKGRGYAFAFSPPGEQEPEVESVRVANIAETEAELQARIRPEGGLTHYVFEYITQQAYEEAGGSFAGALIAGEGDLIPVEQEADVSAVAAGLSPGTEYRFRVVAENALGPDEKQGSFATYPASPPLPACPNEALRAGLSVSLPDCRTYELVTPPDTNGRPPKGIGSIGDRFTNPQASTEGGAVSFIIEGGSLPGMGGTGAYYGDLYLSERSSGGWSTKSAGPTGGEAIVATPGSTSPDQGHSFWTAEFEGSAVIEGLTNYVRYPDGHSELVGRGSLGTDPRARGEQISEGGTHIVFQTQAITGKQPIQLEEEAPPTGTTAVYDRTADEITHVVSLLPGDVTPAAGENAQYVNSSADGEGIAFTLGGTLYLRVNNEETFKVGSGVTFAGVSEGGERVFYMEGGDLKALDTTAGGEGEVIAFTEVGNAVPVNVASDGSRAYFVSTTAIAESGPNPNGDSPVGGQQNLYLSEEGAISFVGAVTARDVEGESSSAGQIDGLGLWTAALGAPELARDPSRTTPDGTVMLFRSRANLDGYDPEGVPQVYRYDRSGEHLQCISCIPTNQPATGGAGLQSSTWEDPFAPFAGSGIVENLTRDGNRAFFQSTEALVSRDSNGLQDVYEWEGQGTGSCTQPGGCVYLITSGHSDKVNYLYAVSRNGDDAFFLTADVLTSFDAGDTLSIYDARVNGGFAQEGDAACIGEGCFPVMTPAPNLPAPESQSRGGSGNIVKDKVCPKGKRKVKRGGRVVCVKKKKKKHHKQQRRTSTARKGAAK